MVVRVDCARGGTELRVEGSVDAVGGKGTVADDGSECLKSENGSDRSMEMREGTHLGEEHDNNEEDEDRKDSEEPEDRPEATRASINALQDVEINVLVPICRSQKSTKHRSNRIPQPVSHTSAPLPCPPINPLLTSYRTRKHP